MTLHVFDLLTNTRKPYIDKYLTQTGIELTTLIPNYQPSYPNDYKRIVHLLLVVYLKRCLSHEGAIKSDELLWYLIASHRAVCHFSALVKDECSMRMKFDPDFLEVIIGCTYENVRLPRSSFERWRWKARESVESQSIVTDSLDTHFGVHVVLTRTQLIKLMSGEKKLYKRCETRARASRLSARSKKVHVTW